MKDGVVEPRVSFDGYAIGTSNAGKYVPSLTYSTGKATIADQGAGSAVFTPTIDFSKYSKLFVKCTSNSKSNNFSVYANLNSRPTVLTSIAMATGIRQIDVSSITQEGYVAFDLDLGWQGGVSIVITDVWLEK